MIKINAYYSLVSEISTAAAIHMVLPDFYFHTIRLPAFLLVAEGDRCNRCAFWHLWDSNQFGLIGHHYFTPPVINLNIFFINRLYNERDM